MARKTHKPEWMEKVDAGLIHHDDMNEFEFLYYLRNYLIKVCLAPENSFTIRRLDELIKKGIY